MAEGPVTFRFHIIFEFLAVWAGALVLNAVWEFGHAAWYVHYQGGPITELVLLRASLFDAGFIAVVAALSRFLVGRRSLGREVGIAVGLSLPFAIGLERWALATGRWAYGAAMPL